MKRFIAIAAVMALCLSASVAFAAELQLKGSTTVYPIAQKVAEAFMKVRPDVKVSIAGGGSGNGAKAIMDGTTDIAMLSRAMKDDEVKAVEAKGAKAVQTIIAFDCIVPIVNPANPVKNLTPAQLKSIYEGKVRKWSEVGGADEPIVVISRDTSSGTYEVWEEKIMTKGRVFPGALLQASSGAVMTAVAKNKKAIGYDGLGYVTPEVKALTIDGIVGSAKTAKDGSFKTSRALFIYTRNEPQGIAADFIKFWLSDAGQKLVSDAGFVPVK